MSTRAFQFHEPAEGAWITVEKPIRAANRLRTRDREIRVLQLCPERVIETGPLCLVGRHGCILIETPLDSPPLNEPLVVPPHTSFYLATEVPAGTRYFQGTSLAEVHPLLIDLGTWFGGPDWRPSSGPRLYLANLRFEVGPVRRRSNRADQILELAVHGTTDKMIAQRLGIGTSTVETHWRLLRERGGFASRTEAVAAHLQERADREREDLEAQRDRLATTAWLKEQGELASTRTVGVMRSWPLP